MTERQLWSAKDIARELGFKNAAVARTWIARVGLKHETTTGPRDTRMYDPNKARALRADQPGCGWWGAHTPAPTTAPEHPTQEHPAT